MAFVFRRDFYRYRIFSTIFTTCDILFEPISPLISDVAHGEVPILITAFSIWQGSP